MARNLYRFYLYAISITMVVYAAVGVGGVLQLLLATALPNGQYGTRPSHAAIVQATVFAIISWIITALLGGLHYWLIRRDLRQDAAAGTGAVRAFFLNAAEAISLPLAVGVSAFSVFGFDSPHGSLSISSGSAAFSLTTFGLIALLEWERRRAKAESGVALLFQRLHFYGVQLVLLFLLTSAWLTAIAHISDRFLFGGKGFCIAHECDGTNLLILVGSALWITLFWVGYGYLTRQDTPSLLRHWLHFASFAYGIGFLLTGSYGGIHLALLAAFKLPLPQSPYDSLVTLLSSNSRNFLSLIFLGVLVIGMYRLWLNQAATRWPEGKLTTALTTEAITTAFLAVSFWWGCGSAVNNALDMIFSPGSGPGLSIWLQSIALVITGLSYIPFNLHLHKRSVQFEATGPYRGFIFALLGGGIVAGGIGATVVLYATGTALLGSPLTNWQFVARSAAAALVVGITIVGIYFLTGMRAQLFSELTKRHVLAAVTPVPTLPPRASTIEEVLDAVLAGKITRDEAAEQIRTLVYQVPTAATP